jgi:hypothetical protein
LIPYGGLTESEPKKLKKNATETEKIRRRGGGNYRDSGGRDREETMTRSIRDRLTAPRTFERALAILLLLNLLDAAFTLTWVYSGVASEANPVMAGAISLGPGVFIATKVALVTLAVALLWRNREHLTARWALVPVSLLYALVAGGHIGFAILTVIHGGAVPLAAM